MLEEGTSVRILLVNFRGDGVLWQSAGIAIVALVNKFVACLLHMGWVVWYDDMVGLLEVCW